jgi:predicted glycoside hydrolase/deacetylase ChbG (UPF0249 family)
LIAIKEEISSQIGKFISEVGFKPSHLDSHGHSHVELSIIRLIGELMSDYDIEYLRPPRNIGRINFIKKCYKNLYRYWASTYGIKFVDYFGLVNDLNNTSLQFSDTTTIEIECHCNRVNGKLLDLGTPFSNSLYDILEKHKKINYSKLSNNKYS